MKPDPLDTAVVNHRMDDHAVEQRSHRSKDTDTDSSPTDKNSSHTGSPRNSDVIFESWDMHNSGDESDHEPAGQSDVTSTSLHPVVFRWHGEGQKVLLSGSFDGWKTKIPLVRSQSEMFAIINIPQGVHQYKFQVDGRWLCHPCEPQVVGDIGSLNNVLTLSEHDCDVFTALNSDDAGKLSPPTADKCTSPPSKLAARIPPSGYCQFIPARDATGCHFTRHGPPALPPHLLQSVLNTDLPEHMDPTLLPEPNHVVLNHTFTLSIRDGVMVLSASHRYRHKFITTLLYRPM